MLGLTNSARTLASITVRDPVGRALDLGTACGVQALLTAPHAEQVVAVDPTPGRCGSPTSPAAERHHQSRVPCGRSLRTRRRLIVTNPPFVISSSREYLFCDSALDEGTGRFGHHGSGQAVLLDGAVTEQVLP